MSDDIVAAFLASLDRTSPREEVYDTTALEAMSPADRSAAEDGLLRRLEDGDVRAAMTLAALGCARALPALERLAASPGRSGSFGRRAVLVLRPDDEAAARAVAEDAGRGSTYERLAALEALTARGGAALRAALEGALDADDAIVRRHAAERYLEALDLGRFGGDAGDWTAPGAPLGRLCWLIASEMEALHRYAAAELKRIGAALAAGATAAELDLVFRPLEPADFRATLSDALLEPGAPIPVDFIRGLGDRERALAEAVLALRLQPAVSDPRAPLALAALEARWTVPALEEAARQGDPASPFASAVAQALARLSSGESA